MDEKVFLGVAASVCILAFIFMFTMLPNASFVAVGVLPFFVIILSFVILAIIALLMGAPKDALADLSGPMVAIVAIIVGVLLFVSLVCARIQPIELFVTPDPIATLEGEVCALVKTTNDYIGSDVGTAGLDNPSLVTAAQAQAVAPAIPITDCSGCTDCSGSEDRLRRMERTLDLFVEPVMKRACIKAGICPPIEPFVDAIVQLHQQNQQNRMDAIALHIKKIKTLYVDPMDKKRQELQGGTASDDDKQKGAASLKSIGSS
jgi:hypothetical protein